MSSFSQAQLDALNAAIAIGATRVTVDGNTTEYRSLDEMFRVRAKMQQELADAASARPTHIQPRFERPL
ncbi:phage head-tail joining protein [Pelagovum pacificum]|uniref:Uncharacterized protein n=1 Tax=Pelagovum pacificum TaxID=2588711 RepID=A0A5C5GDY5_9RHOB|nr:hypothetical protein [Pelagovum pacificum]QQA43948.1 hypothetical protein I8N54_05050 [Pelagovum pacificum]TNY32923.1 hypothetical protein FHY64_06500 [Pelagovum pacificum]